MRLSEILPDVEININPDNVAFANILIYYVGLVVVSFYALKLVVVLHKLLYTYFSLYTRIIDYLALPLVWVGIQILFQKDFLIAYFKVCSIQKDRGPYTIRTIYAWLKNKLKRMGATDEIIEGFETEAKEKLGQVMEDLNNATNRMQ